MADLPQQTNELLKIVELLDCEAGLRDDGRPIVILRFGHLSEIEPSLMLSRWDAQRLLPLLLQSLATHGDSFASHLADRLADVQVVTREGEERADPSLGAWPAKPKRPRRKK